MTPERFRPRFHFTAPQGWINDPNGLIYFEGEYHLFYQHLAPQHWGHAVSTDLVHWEHLPIALEPDELGAIWSGSVVVDWHNHSGLFPEGPGLAAFFTHCRDGLQQQSLAVSHDRGRTWRKYSGNPIIPNPGVPDFRDPKVFWHEPRRHWVLLLATGDHLTFYTSRNLLSWTLASTFRSRHVTDAHCWECPDLFELPIDATRRKWVLLCSYLDSKIFRPFPTLGDSGTRYFVGEFDGERFIEEGGPSAFPAFAGPDDYAAITWNRGGTITALGWMNNWVYAPSDLPTETWKGQMSLPRELRLEEGAQGLVLKQNPVKSLNAFRQSALTVPPRKIERSEELIPEIVGTSYELIVEFENRDAKEFGLKLRVGARHYTTVGYEAGHLFLDRTHSGESAFSQHFARRYFASVPLEESRLVLHVFVDQSSVEVFAQDGLCYLAALIFPEEDAQQISVFAEEGSAMMRAMTWYALE